MRSDQIRPKNIGKIEEFSRRDYLRPVDFESLFRDDAATEGGR